MIWIRVLAIVLLSFLTSLAQVETRDDSIYSGQGARRPQLRWILDTPTAGTLPRGAFDIDMRTFNGGGLQAALGIGLMDRFSVSLAYGAARVLSDTQPDWNPRLEVELKLRLLDESKDFPAIAAGYNSQGYGFYDSERERYQIKSRGFYISFTKNFKIYSNSSGIHWGANYSLENKNDNDPDIWLGFNSDLGGSMMFLAEYDFALNDNKSDGNFGRGRGYLNLGIQWYLNDDLSLELDLRNLLQNQRHVSSIDREARLVYVAFFY